METSKEGFEACNVTENDPVQGPISWIAPNEEGDHYLICGVGNHCALNHQKAIIHVRHPQDYENATTTISTTTTSTTTTTNITSDSVAFSVETKYCLLFIIAFINRHKPII